MLTIVVTTYLPDGDIGKRRLAYLYESVYSLWEYLVGSDCRLHIADDSKEPNKIDLSKLLFSDISYSNSGHRGIGASLNLALDHVSGNWLYTTDDWLLTSRLDVTTPLKLIDYCSYDAVRVGPVHPNLSCITKFNQELGWWLKIIGGQYAFATRPIIATKELFHRVGPFMEHVDAYECERDYSLRARAHGAKIAAMLEYHHIWTHLGEDYSVGLNDTPN